MNLRFRPVTRDNWLECGRLKVRPDQEHFVAPNMLSLAESKFYPELVPLAIYDDETMVGFLMYGYDEKEDSFWVVRLMIDQRYQGRGYALGGMKYLLDMLRAIPGCRRVRISYEPENQRARGLYASLGFIETGEIIEGEAVAEMLMHPDQEK